LNSNDWGRTWRDISLLPPQTQTVGIVYDLAFYTDPSGGGRLLAATGTGLQFLHDIDTGYWHPLDPQLKGVTPKSLDVTYYSKSKLAEIFVSSDSGVHVLSGRFGSSDWVRLFDRKTDCITSVALLDPGEWFAGTADGIWRYTPTSGVISGRLKSVSCSSLRLSSYSITLDGKKTSDVPSHSPSGIIIKGSGDKDIRLK
jgi:hypothetical protein